MLPIITLCPILSPMNSEIGIATWNIRSTFVQIDMSNSFGRNSGTFVRFIDGQFAQWHFKLWRIPNQSTSHNLYFGFCRCPGIPKPSSCRLCSLGCLFDSHVRVNWSLHFSMTSTEFCLEDRVVATIGWINQSDKVTARPGHRTVKQKWIFLRKSVN